MLECSQKQTKKTAHQNKTGQPQAHGETHPGQWASTTTHAEHSHNNNQRHQAKRGRHWRVQNMGAIKQTKKGPHTRATRHVRNIACQGSGVKKSFSPCSQHESPDPFTPHKSNIKANMSNWFGEKPKLSSGRGGNWNTTPEGAWMQQQSDWNWATHSNYPLPLLCLAGLPWKLPCAYPLGLVTHFGWEPLPTSSGPGTRDTRETWEKGETREPESQKERERKEKKRNTKRERETKKIKETMGAKEKGN